MFNVDGREREREEITRNKLGNRKDINERRRTESYGLRENERERGDE